MGRQIRSSPSSMKVTNPQRENSGQKRSPAPTFPAMAAKEVNPACAVCQKSHVYDTDGPFLLPCLHSVCVNCLKSENDETLLCSFCQESFPKSSFPIDAVTRKKTLLFTIVNNSNELLCTNREDGNQAMSWCQECEAFLCEHCHVAHGDMKATRKHKVVLVQDLTNCPQTLKCMSYCDQHAQLPFTLYDSSCNVPLCVMCVLAEHTSCKTKDLDPVWESRQTFLEDKLGTLRAKLDRLKDCRSLRENIGQRLKRQQEAVEDVIRCTFQKLHLMLKQREIELNTEIDESTKFLAQRNDQQLVTLESEVDKLTMTLDFIQTSTLLLNPVEHFAMKDVIDKRIMLASESEVPRVNSQEYSMTFSRDGLHGLQQQLSSLGALLPSRIRSVAGSVGANEGFSMFGQTSGKSFSTPSALGDAVGFTFKTEMPALAQPSPQPQPQPQPDTTLGLQMARKSIFTTGNLGAGVKIASTPLTMESSPQTSVKMVLARNEELVKINSQLVEALRENRELIGQLKSQLNLSQKYNYSGLSTLGPHMTSPYHPTGSSPAVFGQAQTGMPASAALGALSAKQQQTVQSGETPKPSFGGFTFSTTPVIKTPEDKSKASPTVKLKESSLKVTSPAESGTVAANQPKPFAGFTFTPTKPMTQQAAVTVAPSSASAASTVFTLGQNTGSPMPSFSNLTASTSATEFSGLKTGHDSPSKGEDEDRVEEYEPNVDFKPVIDLPDLVEMKTGEENEEKLFGERARLFRFDADANQWKERGIGEVKILFNKTARRYRILMRREQVLKICANHYITKDMKLTPMTSSDRAWSWSPMDFAEEEMKMERLAIKFKTPELACQFKECFEKYQNMLEDAPVKQVPKAIGSSEVAEKKEDPKGQKTLADLFKPKTGSWECQGCLCMNRGEQLRCPACNAIKPGAEEEVKKSETVKPAAGISSGGFKIGEGGFQIAGAAGGGGGFRLGKKQEGGGFNFGSASSGGGFSFASKPAQKAEPSSKDSSKETAVDPGREAAKNILKSNASTIGPGGFSLGGGGFKLDGVGSDGFSFSPKPSTPAKPTKSEPADSTTGGLLAEMLQSNDPQPKTAAASSAATSGFSFTPKSSGFSFASAADSAKKDGGFQFNLGKVSNPVKNQDKKESSSPFQFTFSLTPSKTPQSKATVTSPKSPEGDYYVNKEGEDSHIYFEPIVSLPDKVDVRTGEEEEVTRFEQRAKLFRFSEGEWKERGLGTMKILEHKTSHRYRLLMRREQIFKVCCNHVITPELELKPMASGDGKSWVWYAKDFSEEEGKVEQLAIRFRNKEIADQFKKEFDAGKAGGVKGASAAAAECVSAKHTEDTSDVQILYIEEATEEQKARARKYLLPESFYLYESKPPCPRCIGCEDYDPSKVTMRSKVKAKSKSEETSPAPTSASVKVSSSASSVAGSVGASEGFCMFGQASGMSFSTLAAQGDAAGFAFKKDENRPFQWSGAGQQIFGSSPGGNKTKPIIELPELVEVKTGEEGWEVVYCQRSKLFRFVRDLNQWKERAVGDMKILKQDDKYRMLMRRDQVHKVACNHLIAPNMVLSPMATSETALCWTAQDYAENEAKIEQFALRFKTEELAKQFRKKFEEVQELIRQTQAASPTKNANNSAAEPKRLDASVTEEEDEDDDNDDSEEESIVFEKRATLTYLENNEWKKLGMGTMMILYNEDLNGNQIDMDTDDKLKICNHIICREHSIRLEKPKRECMWSALDFSTDEPVRRNFKASFSSVAAAEEFAKSFMEGVSLARDSELSEKISQEMDTPVIFSHGDATGVGRKFMLQLFNMFVYIALAVTSPSTVSGLELNDSPDLNSYLCPIPAQRPGQSRILVCQSEASSATSMGGSSQCETRMQSGFSEGNQSAASSQTGEGVSANDAISGKMKKMEK